MDSLDGLSGMYSDYADIYNTSSSTTIKDKLNNTDYSKSTDDELMEACKEFEAYFVEQAFKALQKMVPESEESSSGNYMEYFDDTLVQEYAKSATYQGDGFGIAKMLYEQMQRNYGVNAITSENLAASATNAKKEMSLENSPETDSKEV